MMIYPKKIILKKEERKNASKPSHDVSCASQAFVRRIERE